MEGWNGEDENSVPTVNVSLYYFFLVLHGVQGELYPKACLVSLQWTKFTYPTDLHGHLYLGTLQAIEATPAP
jgi:hypothetical protein